MAMWATESFDETSKWDGGQGMKRRLLLYLLESTYERKLRGELILIRQKFDDVSMFYSKVRALGFCLELGDSDRDLIDSFIDGLAMRVKPFLVNQKGDHQSLRFAFEAAAKIEASMPKKPPDGQSSGGKDPKVIKCFKCGKEGHKSFECPEKKKELSGFAGDVEQDEEEDYFSMMCGESL